LSRDVIVFSHANGFPAGTYKSLFAIWRRAGFELRAIERFGHDPRFPVSNNWPHLRDELIHFIDHEVGQPAYLVGHSMGGFVSVLAASHRPDLARGVVLLDSPIISGWKAKVVQLFKTTGVGERFSPGFVSKKRRHQWPDRNAAYEHFASKTAFARWAPGVLRDYIESGVEPDETAAGGGHRLRFRREVETEIYNSLPHHVPKLLRRHPLHCPLAFIGGTASDEVRRVGLDATRRLAHGRLAQIDGSHLFPLERPAETAAEVLRQIEAMRAQTLAT
jgi:pimeloyl-ACP methyl ester carboxylesterase